jgi:hypothetical protein
MAVGHAVPEYQAAGFTACDVQSLREVHLFDGRSYAELEHWSVAQHAQDVDVRLIERSVIPGQVDGHRRSRGIGIVE